MKLSFCSIQIKHLDVPTLDRGTGQSLAEISVEMADEDAEAYLDVTAKVPVRADVNQTLAQVRQQSVDNAVVLLRTIADLLEKHGPEKLAQLMYEREDAELRGTVPTKRLIN